MVLVTGASGLLGSHVLIELLKKGKKVRALKRPFTDLSMVKKTFSYYSPTLFPLLNQVEWVDGDLNTLNSLLDAMEDVEEVYHCAAVVSFLPKDRKEMLRVNMEGTENIINAALESGVQKFCHVSSIAAFGNEHETITEDTHWKSSPDNSFYAISKYGAEREVWRGMEEGLNAVIVNPSVIIGPGNLKSGSSHLFDIAAKGLRFYTDGVTGFVDVRDVASVMLQLMERNIFKQRMIVSSENIGFREFFDLAADCFNKPRPGLRAGKLMGQIAWRAEAIRSVVKKVPPIVTKETAKAAHQKKYYSNDRVRKTLDFTFIPVAQSIRETCSLFNRDLNKN